MILKKTYGRLTVISKGQYQERSGHRRLFVTVKCICGNTNEVRADLLDRGKIKSCGCLAKEIKRPLKKRYGRLTVISEPYRRYDLVFTGPMHVNVLCDCGEIKSVRISSLNRGDVKSCGCLVVETTAKRATTHGLSKHPLFGIWSNILGRCYNNSRPDYENYGGFGITVCKEWRNDFKSFYDWCIANGWRKGLQVDKDIKGGKIYSPSNCLIITPKENGRHTRATKLSMAAAENIRSLYATGNYTLQKIADMYNIGTTSISQVVLFKQWT